MRISNKTYKTNCKIRVEGECPEGSAVSLYDNLCSQIGAGDYLFIQFGHNDEKIDEATYPGLGTYAELDQSTLDSEGKDASGRYSYEWIILNKYIKSAQATMAAGAQYYIRRL